MVYSSVCCLRLGFTVLTTCNLDPFLCSFRTTTSYFFYFLCSVDHITWLTLIGQLPKVKMSIISLINCWKSCRQKQSSKQILALALLISAAVLLSVGESSSKGSKGGSTDYVLLYGIIPVTVASMLSGLASSLCQWASQVELTYHITFEDAIYSPCSLLTY